MTTARSPTEVSSVALGTADRHEVERAIEMVTVDEAEVRGGDRGHEARVERHREPERRVDALPAGTERELVRAELAGVEEPEDPDLRETRLQEVPVLGEGVLLQVPRGV